jgi:hypothetical protein
MHHPVLMELALERQAELLRRAEISQEVRRASQKPSNIVASLYDFMTIFQTQLKKRSNRDA